MKRHEFLLVWSVLLAFCVSFWMLIAATIEAVVR